ncbi:MAG TPA: oligopeptide/dipeptide ABC transporter ATP-binding protein [Stellaceae bacterium]|nr:oligopeptide/dipeptide ABC transporter ATP-binding protein [Stellaceae bacterium]
MALLEIDRLNVSYRTRHGRVSAVSDVSLQIEPGETFGLVGESGCGKSSLGRAVIRLTDAESGAIRLDGTDLVPLSGGRLTPYRHLLQMIFQDPAGSLDPRRRVSWLIAEPLAVERNLSAAQRRERVGELMATVGLPPQLAERLPHELSGGQRQRVAIARAIARSPRLVICDEPVSALDVSLQAQILNLLVALQRDKGIAYLFISHDLSVVQHIADRVAVMYLGRVVETARRADLWLRPAHPYTVALIEAVPVMNPAAQRIEDKKILSGDLPSPYGPPAGCAFHTRCPCVLPRCRSERPELREIAPDHLVACHLHG